MICEISAMENENDCVFMFIIGNHYGIKCLNQLQLEPCNVMFKVISDKIAHWYNI